VALVALVLASLFAAATTLAGAATSAKSPPWTPVPGVRGIFGEGRIGLGWASDRVWVAHTGPRDQVPVTSARIVGRKLIAFKTSHLGGLDADVRLFVGSEFVSLPVNGSSPQTRSLLATGAVGQPSVVPLDTKQFAPNHPIRPAAAVRLGDRAVWALPGTTREFNSRAVFWVCCASDRSARDLTRLIDRASPPNPVRLSLDERGRLWLAWHDRSGTKLLELDPSSLLPRTSNPIEAPVRGVERFEMVCATACRLVMRSFISGIHSWAPGEKPTRIAKLAGQEAVPELLAASYRSGKLVVAYKPGNANGINVVRGDARGARSRIVSTTRSRSVYVLPTTHAVFVPAGLIAITPRNPNAYTSGVLITLMPVGR
jgi:hypothetical protein